MFVFTYSTYFVQLEAGKHSYKIYAVQSITLMPCLRTDSLHQNDKLTNCRTK